MTQRTVATLPFTTPDGEYRKRLAGGAGAPPAVEVRQGYGGLA
ncbi:hypothetical protein [Salinilacihabitans rarus]|nr:hypothetical protein [Salinilacihabitans rarus]